MNENKDEFTWDETNIVAPNNNGDYVITRLQANIGGIVGMTFDPATNRIYILLAFFEYRHMAYWDLADMPDPLPAGGVAGWDITLFSNEPNDYLNNLAWIV